MATLFDTIPMEANQLKKTLEDLQEGERSWKKEHELLIIKSMMEHIGSSDSELRDNLIYGTFCKLILNKKIEHKLLIEMLDFCLGSSMLFKGIREVKSDTVFTRSFTSLLIALLLYKDNEDGFLTRHMVLKVKDDLIVYMEQENDLRGFVHGKGWAHSVAHAADAFDELIKNKNIKSDVYSEILNSLWNKAFMSHHVYIHDEDERLLVPILELLNKGLDPKEIENLAKDIPLEIERLKKVLKEENYWMLYSNCKKFLKSFYIVIEDIPGVSSLKQSLKKCILEM